jgi:hypothetical protein
MKIHLTRSGLGVTIGKSDYGIKNPICIATGFQNLLVDILFALLDRDTYILDRSYVR